MATSHDTINATPCGGEYIRLHKRAVACEPHQFAELWLLASTLSSNAATESDVFLPQSAVQVCSILTAIKDDVVVRLKHSAALKPLTYTVRCSSKGKVGGLLNPDVGYQYFSYTFNAPGSFPRHLNINSTDQGMWTLALSSGDMLSYRTAQPTGDFRFKTNTDLAHCNGQRIVVTVAAACHNHANQGCSVSLI